MDQSFDARGWLGSLAGETRDVYAKNRRVMSFGEYLALFGENPKQQSRSAAEYLRDVFDHFGHEAVNTPRGEMKRFKLFDCPWDGGRDRLMGQEEVQDLVYRLLSNFAREGRTNRLILLHGPNGSAKSTFIGCVQRAMEHYASLDEGAVYRFNWIFPVQKLVKGGIGFGDRGPEPTPVSDSYAYLDDDLIEAKLVDELKDHPLLLIPRDKRKLLLDDVLAGPLREGFRPARLLADGDLNPRNRMIFEALLNSYRGDLGRVLRHVQVERFFISRRYRVGVATVGPQLAVDASARQLTVGKNLAGLPPAVSALPLFEYQGELVDANRGVVEFADLLKRPLDAFKYLLGTVEDGHVSLDAANLQVDTVFLASSNEGYLSAFKEIPEFQSFKGRMELVRAPYLLDYKIEEQIYQEHLTNAVGGGTRHVAPHVAWVAALWAVLTRMRKPMTEKYGKATADLVGRLSPIEKATLYAGDDLPEGFTSDQIRDLNAEREKVARESDSYPNYEGRSGASPREMKLAIMNAGQSTRFSCFSPFAVLDELEELVKAVSVYDFLKQEPVSGGYHEHRKFVFQVREKLIDRIDHEVRVSMGLVEEQRYLDQFSRYISQVSSWIKGEKVYNPITRKEEPASEEFMSEIEKHLDVGTGSKREEWRRDIISRIGAWSVDHPNRRPDLETLFPRHIQSLREAFFNENKKRIRKLNESLLRYLTEGESALDKDALEDAKQTLSVLKSRFGYCQDCAKDSIVMLVKKRYSGS
ncbi:MAG: serine protein kinase PrkA [Deltaproteobacteria bacterium]|nr:serine protein kinase PrkA [Deltaproteobacteria bacterium]